MFIDKKREDFIYKDLMTSIQEEFDHLNDKINNIEGSECEDIKEQVNTNAEEITTLKDSMTTLENKVDVDSVSKAISDAISGADGKIGLPITTNDVVNSFNKTQDEINKSFYKGFSAEFVSNGEDIVINDVIGDEVFGARLEGQTVKNYATVHIDGKNPSKYTPLSFDIELNKTYTIVFEQLSGASDYGFICLTKGFTRLTTPYNAKIQISNKQPNGVRFGVVQTNYASEIPTNGEFGIEISGIPALGTISDKIIILEGDCTNKIDYYTFDSVGLSSTKATITNNGEKYSFYNPIIEGKTVVMRTPKGTNNWVEISEFEERDVELYDYKLSSPINGLNGTSRLCDYIDRSRKIKVINTKEIVLDGSQPISNAGVMSNVSIFKVTVPDMLNERGVGIIAATIKSREIHNNLEGIYTQSGYIYIGLKQDKVKPNINSYLQTNPITVRYQLATPIEVPLTDEEFEEYENHKKVIELDGIKQTDSISKSNSLSILEDGSCAYTENIITLNAEKLKAYLGRYYFNKFINEDKIQYRCFIDDYPRAVKETVFQGISTKTNLGFVDTIQDKMHGYDSIGNRCSVVRTAPSIIIILTEESLQPKDRLNPTREDFINYFNRNSDLEIKVIVEPKTTIIDKSITPPVIPTQQNNVFSFGEEVKSSKAMVKVATAKTSDLSKFNEIELQVKTNTASINSLRSTVTNYGTRLTALETKLNNLNNLVVSLQLQLDAHEGQL